MTVTIWHNPRCSKSRQTLALLRAHDIEPDIRAYLDDAPSRDELAVVSTLLGIPVLSLARTGERLFSELGLSRSSSENDLLDALSENPRLIERPIVFANGNARIGRPPEAVLEIL